MSELSAMAAHAESLIAHGIAAPTELPGPIKLAAPL